MRQTQNLLEGLHTPSGLGTPRDLPGRVSGQEEAHMGYFAYPPVKACWTRDDRWKADGRTTELPGRFICMKSKVF